MEIFKPKLFTLIKAGLDKKQVTNDVMSGMVVGIVALPLSIAFAVASGVSPDKGLITAVIAGFLISFLGGSRVQIGGPTGAFIVIVYGIVEQYGVQGLIISTVMAGIMLVLMGVLRLGTLLKFIPHPLIVGFTSGIALVIFSTQVKDALGLEITKVPSEFIDKWEVYFQQIATINPTALLITLLTILTTIYGSSVSGKIPGSFLAIVLSTLVVVFFDLPVTTIESFFGNISGSFSFQIPAFVPADLINYVQPALAIALLGGIESLLSAVVADGMIGGNHRSNTELVAQGIANIVTPFFGGIPATGALARTATNVKNGGRTPISGIIHAITLLLIMLFFGRWAKLIPMATLAGILIVVAYNMSEWRSFISILKSSWFDKLVLLTTFFLTVLVDLVIAIEVGVVLASLLFMKRMADVTEKKLGMQIDTDVLEDYSTLPEGISVYEISGPLFFASAKRYTEVMKTIGEKSRVMIIRMRHVPFMDATGVHNFKASIQKLKKGNIDIILSGVNVEVHTDLEKHGISNLIGSSNILDTFHNAVKRAAFLLKQQD